MLLRVVFTRTDVSEKRSSSIIKVVRIVELETALAITRNRLRIPSQRSSVASYCLYFPSSPILVTLMIEMLRSSETSDFKRATWRNIPEDGIFHTHRSEYLKSHVNKLISR
jgi:hypothetical protein